MVLPRIDGWVERGFEPVARAFADNFAERAEHGAAFAALLDGEPVVDLWAGTAEAGDGQRWREGTVQLIFSGTKGLVATCLLILVDRGQLALGDRVGAHWPQFAAAGKEEVTVAQLVSHTARLPAVRTPLAPADLTAGARIAELLAAQPQEQDPRARATYHALTFGWLCGELVRRVDGRSIGRFFAEEVAAPLDLELWIGLPAEHEERVTQLRYGPGWGASQIYDAEACARDPLAAAVWANPPLFPVSERELPWNTRAFHAAEIPGANAIGTARSIARLYGCLARGGELDGVRLLSAATIARGRQRLSRFDDPLSGEPLAYGTGFQLQSERAPFGPTPDAFGHTGAGGSVHGAWPGERIGFSYATNELRDDPDGDPRAAALLSALRGCLPSSARRRPLGASA